jgi:hypothetical protein
MINEQEVMVTCPRGVRPSQRVTFQLPTQERRSISVNPNHQMFEVTVPEGVKPGTSFALIANGQRYAPSPLSLSLTYSTYFYSHTLLSLSNLSLSLTHSHTLLSLSLSCLIHLLVFTFSIQ